MIMIGSKMISRTTKLLLFVKKLLDREKNDLDGRIIINVI